MKKKMKAPRFETLHDTTLCKVLSIGAEDVNADDGNADGTSQQIDAEDESATNHVAGRMLQVHVIQIFRQGIRHLREIEPAENPLWHDDTANLISIG